MDADGLVLARERPVARLAASIEKRAGGCEGFGQEDTVSFSRLLRNFIEAVPPQPVDLSICDHTGGQVLLEVLALKSSFRRLHLRPVKYIRKLTDVFKEGPKLGEDQREPSSRIRRFAKSVNTALGRHNEVLTFAG